MVTLKTPVRIFLFIVVGFLISGLIQWRLAATEQPTNFEHYQARALSQQQLKDPSSEPSEMLEDLQLQVLSYDVEQFRHNAKLNMMLK